MEKRKVLMGIAILMFLVFLFHSGAIAGGFSFIGIRWDDTPKQVFKKMAKNGMIKESEVNDFLDSYRSMECEDGPFEHVIGTSMVDEKEADRLRKSSYLDAHDYPDRINNLKSIGLGCTGASPAKHVDFIFSCDDKLLSYVISLDVTFTDDEEETKEGQFYRSLVEKYGPPQAVLTHSKKWSKDGQSLYYFAVSSIVQLIYVNNKNIDKKLAEFQTKRDEFKKASEAKEAESVKKRF